MTKSEVTIRRRDISAYLTDHPTVSFDKPSVIAKALNMDIDDVKNDLRFLKQKLQEDYSQYNLAGLRDKANIHVTRLKELQKEASIGVESDNMDIKLKSIDTELKLIHNIYQLEQDGIGVLTEEINHSKK